MKLTKFEQSGFILETNAGFRLAFDIGVYTPVEKLKGLKVDAFLVSHIHGDHFSLEQIKALSPQNVYLNKECIAEIGEENLPFSVIDVSVGDDVVLSQDMSVQIFNVDHGPNISAPLAENFGFLFSVDGKKVYFAGDMFYASGIGTKDLEVDVALIPVGGFYTFDPIKAYEFVKMFKRIGEVVPMHYEKTPETCGQFIELASNDFEIKKLV